MSQPIHCPLCSAESKQQALFSHNVFHGKPDQAIFRCARCDLTYLHPMLTTEEKDQFYAEAFPEFMAGRASGSGGAGWLDAEAHIAENESQRLRRMKYLEPLLPEPGGRILDVGCASGFMLYPLAERGYECVGIEPTESSRNYLGSRDLMCFENMSSLLGDPVAEEGFDLIMHFFVADQTEDPVQFINEQLPLLKSGGKLVFEINSTDDPMISLYQLEAFDKFFWAIAQNYYFSRKSFQFIMDNFELPHDIILDQRYDLSNHLVWAIEGKPGGMGRFTEVLDQETEDYYKQALVRAGRCDTLIGILRP